MWCSTRANYKLCFPASLAAWVATWYSLGQWEINRHGDSDMAFDFLIKGSTCGWCCAFLFSYLDAVMVSAVQQPSCTIKNRHEGSQSPALVSYIHWIKASSSLLPEALSCEKTKSLFVESIVRWVLCYLKLKHSLFDSTKAGLVDALFPPWSGSARSGRAVAENIRIYNKEISYQTSFLQVKKLSHIANHEPFWSLNLIFISISLVSPTLQIYLQWPVTTYSWGVLWLFWLVIGVSW